MKKFVRLITLPFEILGDFFVQIGNFIRIISGNFFMSVWGLIIPIAILLAIAMALFVAQNQRDLAADYAAQLMSCEDNEIDRLVEILRSLETAGLIELLNGLRSDREKIFFACQDAIVEELNKLPKMHDEKKRNKIYLELTNAILHQIPNFKPVAKNAVHQLVQKIITDLLNIKSDGRSYELQLVTLNCERIQAIVEPTLQQGREQNGTLQPSSSKTIARYRSNSFNNELFTANGKPFKQTILNGKNSLDNLYTENYIADNNSSNNYNSDPVNNSASPINHRSNSHNSYPNENLTNPNLLSDLSTNHNYNNEANNIFPLLPEIDKGQDKIASKHNPHNRNSSDQTTTTIDEHKSTNNSTNTNSLTRQQPSDRSSNINDYSNINDETNYFLTNELSKINFSRIPSLSTVQLMRLLQHPNSNYVLESRRVLIARDGFTEQHLSLAYKLYHRNSAVRKEIITQLSETHGILINTWLIELLNDPNDEIRYNAAARLSISNDPHTRKLLIEKCQFDTDYRIVNLINQLRQR
jgi:hypothetical protein